MPNPVLTNDFKRTVVDALSSGGTPLLDVVHHLSSSALTPSGTTKLADLTESVFTGYWAVPGMRPALSFIDTDGLCKAVYPTNLFQGTDGATQIMSTTLTGPATMAGTLTVVVTAAGMPGTPRTVTVSGIATTDTDADLAEKVEEALLADADVGPFFFIWTQGNTVFLARKAPAANDATMNVSVALGTALGVTAVPTARQDRPGTAAGGTFTAGTVTLQYATDAAVTRLYWAQQIPQATIALPGQGLETSLVFMPSP